MRPLLLAPEIALVQQVQDTGQHIHAVAAEAQESQPWPQLTLLAGINHLQQQGSHTLQHGAAPGWPLSAHPPEPSIP